MEHIHRYITIILLSTLFCSFSPIYAATPVKEIDSNLQFIENKGQWDDNIYYKADLGVGSLFLEDARMTFFLIDAKYLSEHGHHHDEWDPLQPVNCHAYNINFLGASAKRNYKSNFRKKSYRNYFIGKDPNKWASKVGEFKQVVYENIYEGIDFQTYGAGPNLKYDFMVKPFADAAAIQLKYSGVDNIFLRDNKLHVVTSVNEVIEQEPYVYQIINGQKVIVPCQYTLHNKVVGFHFPQGYNQDFELVIDPTLVFASYSGSSSDNWGFSATYDLYGNLYGAGASFGFGYPTNIGAFQTVFGGSATDIAVSKFTPSGDQLIYSTYLGGNSTDIPHSLIVNDLGQLIVFGTTSSANFPVSTNAYDPSFNGGQSQSTSSSIGYTNGSDIILTIFNPDGTDLIGSTYIGGSRNDGLNFITSGEMNYGDDARGEVFVDRNYNIYVGTTTFSSDFPTTSGVFGPNFSGGQKDGCLIKMSFDLSSMIWSTYLGGSQNDGLFSLKLDENDNIFVCGYTESTDFPTSTGAVNTNYQGGQSDGFITKINPNATQILASSYLGASNVDRAYFLDFDTQNFVYVTGQSNNGQYPVTSGVFSNPGSSQFLHKLNANLMQTEFSTIFGNGNGDRELAPSAFMVDICDRIYFSGWGGNTNHGQTSISGMPITGDAFQASTDGSDFYFIVFQEGAVGLEYASYFGGGISNEHVDGGTSRFDKTGTIYQAVCAGCGGSNDFPTSPGAHSQTNQADNCNLGVIKFDFEQPLVVANGLPSPNFSGCAPFDVNFENLSVGATDYFWDFGDNTTSIDKNPNHVYNTPGFYTVTLVATGTGTCSTVDTATMNVAVLGNDATNVVDHEICNNEFINLAPSFGVQGASYEWYNGSSQFSINVNTPGTYWVQTSLSNCNFVDSFNITLSPFEGITFDTLGVCPGDSLTLAATSPSDNDFYVWNNGDNEKNIVTSNAGNYWVQSFSNTCIHVDNFYIEGYLEHSESSTQSICEGDTLFWQGNFYIEDTIVTKNLTSFRGCDSTISLVLITNSTYANTTAIQACPTTPFTLPDGTLTSEPGTYDSNFSSIYGCDSVETTILSFFPSTGYLAIIEDSISVKLGYSERLHVGTNLTDSLQWSPVTYLDCDDCLSVAVTPFHTTEYFASSLDEYGCAYLDSVTVYVDDTKNVYIPNAFSPNGDGINDLFQIYTDKGVESILSLRIYDRWGNLVYLGKDQQPNDPVAGWNGQLKDQEMNPAVFVYLAEVLFLNGEKGLYTGDLTLIR